MMVMGMFPQQALGSLHDTFLVRHDHVAAFARRGFGFDWWKVVDLGIKFSACLVMPFAGLCFGLIARILKTRVEHLACKD